MYDIEFQMGVCVQDHYLQRLIDFKKYGLCNIGNKKVLVKLLTGREILPAEAKKGWSVETEIISSNNIIGYPHTTHLLPKLYNYYPNMSDETVSNARWFCRIDDDSITDVSGLVDNLDLEYDHERDYYIVTICGDDAEEHHFDKDLAKEFGYERWFSYNEYFPEHEIECCILSQSAMRKIVQNETAKSFLRRRGAIHDGFGDVALAYAARMCKIYPHKAPFLFHEPHLQYFSLFGGKLNHIHWISHDINGKLFRFYKRAVENKLCNEEQWKTIEGKTYNLYKGKKIIDTITFNKNGTLKSEIYKFWYIKDRVNDLVLLNHDAAHGMRLQFKNNSGDLFLGERTSLRTIKP